MKGRFLSFFVGLFLIYVLGAKYIQVKLCYSKNMHKCAIETVTALGAIQFIVLYSHWLI